VRYDPVWKVIYGGCFLVIIGAFVQFFLGPIIRLLRRLLVRLGFVTGSDTDRARAAARALAHVKKKGPRPAPATASRRSARGEPPVEDFEEL
jgi:hypothetical protein